MNAESIFQDVAHLMMSHRTHINKEVSESPASGFVGHGYRVNVQHTRVSVPLSKQGEELSWFSLPAHDWLCPIRIRTPKSLCSNRAHTIMHSLNDLLPVELIQVVLAYTNGVTISLGLRPGGCPSLVCDSATVELDSILPFMVLRGGMVAEVLVSLVADSNLPKSIDVEFIVCDADPSSRVAETTLQTHLLDWYLWDRSSGRHHPTHTKFIKVK